MWRYLETLSRLAQHDDSDEEGADKKSDFDACLIELERVCCAASESDLLKPSLPASFRRRCSTNQHTTGASTSRRIIRRSVDPVHICVTPLICGSTYAKAKVARKVGGLIFGLARLSQF
jgi:hypothetical protein